MSSDVFVKAFDFVMRTYRDYPIVETREDVPQKGTVVLLYSTDMKLDYYVVELITDRHLEERYFITKDKVLQNPVPIGNMIVGAQVEPGT